MDEIIKAIEDRLTEKAPAFKYVAEDWGQLSFYSDYPPLKWPCALIDISQGTTTQTGKRIQEMLLTINITIADFSHNPSRNAAEAMKVRAKAIYGLMRAVYVALHGWKPTKDCTAMIRTAFTRKTREDGQRICVLTFTLNWQDISAMPEYDMVHLASGGQ